MTGDDGLVEAIKSDYRSAAIDGRQRAMLDFAVRVTTEVHSVTADTVDALRAAGLSDEQVLDSVQIVGFFNYYNRLVDALGVEPEDFMPPR